MSCSKHGMIRELQFSKVQDAREMCLESITIGFESEYFAIFTANDREKIDQVA